MNEQCAECGIVRADTQTHENTLYCMWCLDDKLMEAKRRKQRMLDANYKETTQWVNSKN